MPRRCRAVVLVVLVVLALLAACAPGEGGDPRPGGATTVPDASPDAFGFPAANLAASRRDAFFVGNSLFKANWVAAPSSTEGRDGLGPLFNALSCSSCHLRDGRGRPPLSDDEPFLGLLLRISRRSPGGEPAPDPVYGDQIQPFALPGLRGEARPRVRFEELEGRYADGTPYRLRRPAYSLEDPGYGALPPDLLLSPRVAPSLIGLGLLEAVPEERLRALADPDDRDRDGISGRPALGRFGWKASQPTVALQNAAAFRGDLGITSPLFPEENSTAAQALPPSPPTGGPHEADAEKLRFLAVYVKTLAVPARRRPRDPEVRRGQELFAAAGCAKCHVPTHVTGDDPEFPELSRQTIHPYTDLLLHDLGPGLADGRPDGRATGSEWRTPPLWGLGLQETVNGHTFLLHDGRARDAAEAILWHGGEAEAAADFFRRLPASDRKALLAFVNDL
jgi:CxxC motif-containing protein (DUF1111 family)